MRSKITNSLKKISIKSYLNTSIIYQYYWPQLLQVTEDWAAQSAPTDWAAEPAAGAPASAAAPESTWGGGAATSWQ
mgnify:CR=1 FL=1